LILLVSELTALRKTEKVHEPVWEKKGSHAEGRICLRRQRA